LEKRNERHASPHAPPGVGTLASDSGDFKTSLFSAQISFLIILRKLEKPSERHAAGRSRPILGISKPCRSLFRLQAVQSAYAHAPLNVAVAVRHLFLAGAAARAYREAGAVALQE
jgi:hypothetical protein